MTGERASQVAHRVTVELPGQADLPSSGLAYLRWREQRSGTGIRAAATDATGRVDGLDQVLELTDGRVSARGRRVRLTATRRKVLAGRVELDEQRRVGRAPQLDRHGLALLGMAEPVAHAADRLDVMPAERYVDLAAQVGDVLVDHVGGAVVGEVPGGFQDL